MGRSSSIVWVLAIIFLVAGCAMTQKPTSRETAREAITSPVDPQLSAALKECLASDSGPSGPTCELVSVLYGSNRVIYPGRSVERINTRQTKPETPFTTKLASDDIGLTLGEVTISVPTNRPKGGGIPRPRFENDRIRRRWFAEDLKPKKHFVFVKYSVMTQAEYVERIKGVKEAFIYVHGYNESFKTAAMVAAQLKTDWDYDGQAFIFSWPALHVDSRGPNYHPSRRNAELSREYFRDFLDLVVENTDAAIINIVAHSMGNYVVLPVLAEMKNAAPATDSDAVPVVSELIMAAPDVTFGQFYDWAASAQNVVAKVTLYASKEDLSWRAHKIICNFGPYSCGTRIGDVPASGPAVLDGVETIDASDLVGDMLYAWRNGKGHDYFKRNSRVIEDISKMIIERRHPPPTRSPEFEEVDGANGLYWRFLQGTME